ncbi:transcription termination factor Rho [Lachnospiraceae bacterium NE2001]|nr:transcription termination factor Rho [Lachnospiraceae bacterium NE2001]
MDFEKMKVSELREYAESKGLRGLSGLKKSELLDIVKKMNQKMAENQPESEYEPKPEKQSEEKKKPTKSSKDKSKQTKPAEEKPKKSKSVKEKQKQTKTAEEKQKQTKTAEEKQKQTKTAEEKQKQTKPLEESKTAEEKPVALEKDEVEKEIELEKSEETSEPETPVNEVAEGILEVMAEGYGFIRSDNYMPGERDIYVSPSQIRRFRLRTGDIVKGPIRRKQNPNEKFSALLYIESVNGYNPEVIVNRMSFENMTPIFPNERLHLDYPGAPVSLRIVDLFSPIGKGQRGMIVSPPKAGKTTLIKQIAKRISKAYPEMNLLVLLIDERPEEVTDIKESIEGENAEVIYSTFDELPEHHKRVSEMVIERAKRLVESGQDVVILIDSITRLSRAYNLTVTPSGRTLSGGLDPAALYMPKKFFGAARNMREGGSLTILATALIDTGSRLDDVVFEEFKGTGNMELVLDRNLQEKRVFPAIDVSKSGTRKDDLLLDADEREILDIIHRRFHSLKPEEVTEDLLKLFSQTRDNKQFIAVANKLFNKR